MYAAMICACVVLLSVVADHYDRRDNVISYRRFGQIGKLFESIRTEKRLPLNELSGGLQLICNLERIKDLRVLRVFHADRSNVQLYRVTAKIGHSRTNFPVAL